jgi:hypothetical protein
MLLRLSLKSIQETCSYLLLYIREIRGVSNGWRNSSHGRRCRADSRLVKNISDAPRGSQTIRLRMHALFVPLLSTSDAPLQISDLVNCDVHVAYRP